MSWTWNKKTCDERLSPDVASLIGCALNVLKQTTACRWDGVKRTGLLSKQLLSIGLRQQSRSYWTTYRLRTCIPLSCIGVGELDKAMKIGVIWGKLFQVSSAVFLDIPKKQDTMSHTLNAWKAGKASALFSPRELAISELERNADWYQCQMLPIVVCSLVFAPAATAPERQSVRERQCQRNGQRCWQSLTRLHLLHGETFLHQLLPVWQGASLETSSRRRVLSTPWPWDETTCFSREWIDAAHWARSRNNSCLLRPFRRNSIQFLGSLFPGGTRCSTPCPRLCRVVAFKLASTYSSQTISMRLTCRSCTETYGANVLAAYSGNVLSWTKDFIMCTRAVPFITITSEFFGASFCWVVSNWGEDARLDFCRGRRKCPSSARDGGRLDFHFWAFIPSLLSVNMKQNLNVVKAKPFLTFYRFKS